MRKNGFTLIELLAVIVILAIIALIATPIILNIINDSKEEATLRSAENYLDAVTQAVARENLNNEFNPSTCDAQSDGNLVCDTGNLTIEVDGEKPTSGTITFNNGKINTVSNLKYGTNTVSTDENGKLVLGESSVDEVKVYQTLTTGTDFNSKIKCLVAGAPTGAIPYAAEMGIATSITFLSNKKLPENYTLEALQSLSSVDVSANNDGSVMAYYDGNGNVYIYSEDYISGSSDLSYMFYNFKTLSTVDASGLDTSNATNMEAMFQNCNNLVTVNLSSFKATEVTNMNFMFYGCTALKTLDLSSFGESKVTTMSEMFYNCASLENVNFSNFKSSNLDNMHALFQNCVNLKEIDMSYFNTSNVTDMSSMFYGCSSLSKVNVSGWNTANVTSMINMFYGCSSLISLDISSFNTKKADMSSMFYNCTNLTCIKVGDDWSTTHENANSSYTFSGAGTSTTTTSACPVTNS